QPEARRELLTLVQRLFINGLQSTQAVVFSAVEPGSGCTFICTQTAEILANEFEGPVCLVDANFRSTKQNPQFEFENEIDAPEQDGWRFMPVGTNHLEAKTSNFWLVSRRPATLHRPRVSKLGAFERLIDDLRKEFPYILIDAPSLQEYADAALFARMSDGLVLVL